VVCGKVYFSGDVVVPVLVPESTLVKVVPSVETETSKRSMGVNFHPPKQYQHCIQTLAHLNQFMKGLTINVDHHFVLRLSSIALVGGKDD
jgi:hypothetical protein